MDSSDFPIRESRSTAFRLGTDNNDEIKMKSLRKDNELLFLMMEDEALWLSNLVDGYNITTENFFDQLKSGVVLCKLANTIQEYANKLKTDNEKTGFLKYFSEERCEKDTTKFFARENSHKFLQWCRVHNIPEPMLFESNDCVEMHRDGGREIIICLMNLARRLCNYYKVPAPVMVQLELGLPQNDTDIVNNSDKDQTNQSALREKYILNNFISESNISSIAEKSDVLMTEKISIETPIINNDEEPKLIDKNKIDNDSKKNVPKNKSNNIIDDKALKIITDFDIPEINWYIQEGKFKINNKVCFIRMVNNRLVVRVGGGWESLEKFLEKRYSRKSNDSRIEDNFNEIETKTISLSKSKTFDESIEDKISHKVKQMVDGKEAEKSPSKLKRYKTEIDIDSTTILKSRHTPIINNQKSTIQQLDLKNHKKLKVVDKK